MDTARPIALLAAAVMLIGCTQGTRPRNTIGQDQRLPALTTNARGMQQADGPSIDGLDRSHWTPQRVIAKPDGSRAWFWRAPMDTRNGGAHPTALSALDAEPRFTPADLLVIPAREALEGALLPFRSARVLLAGDPVERASAYSRYRESLWRTAPTGARTTVDETDDQETTDDSP